MTIQITNVTIMISDEYMKSLQYLISVKKSNLFFTIFFIILGLIGHLMTIFVFGQRRFRRNSSNVYLLCLAITDAAYLIVHFFEDTLKTTRDIYFSSSDFISAINIVEKFDFTCRLFNYLRYTLRFISSYTIVVFTLQRLFLIYSPLSPKFKTKKSAWLSIIIITCIGFLANLWVPFLFEKRNEDSFEYCDVNIEWTKKQEYFHLTLLYTSLTITIPVVITLISNSLMIYNLLFHPNLKRHRSVLNENRNQTFSLTEKTFTNQHNMKPYYIGVDQIVSRITNKANNSKKITIMLIIISISFTFLNIPYLINWSIYYKEVVVSRTDESPSLNYLYSSLKISEIFSILIFSINFYLYCASGSLFRNQLKFSSKSNKALLS